ncbi:MAG: hypothetical protein QXQ29_01010 [Candidatus Bathyarchaeia archaeon]
MLRWLIKRFKYRDLGLTPKIASRLSIREEGLRKQFRVLIYPSASLEKLVEIFSDNLQIPSELLIFSSLYISLAILVGESYKPYIEPISHSVVKTVRDLTVNDWKLHLRIAGYSILDFYEYSIEGCLQTMKSGEAYKSIIERRMKIARELGDIGG